MGHRRVLVVDDSPTIRKLVEIALRGTDWIVELAASGKEAIAAATAAPPDAILLDFVLPDMRGVDVCSRLAHEKTTSAVPIVLMTAKEWDQVKELFAPYSAVVGWLPKPFTAPRLLERLSSLPAETPQNVASQLFTPAQQEQAARALFAQLKTAFAQIPSWLPHMGSQTPAAFFAKKILTPETMERLLRALEPIYREKPVEDEHAPAAFRGEVARWPVTDLLGFIGSAGRTGALSIGYEEKSAILYVRDGQIAFVTTRDPDEYLRGADLGCVPARDALDRAKEEQARSGKPVPISLVDSGSALSVDVGELVARLGRRVLLDVIDAGTVSFAWRDLAKLPAYVDAHGRRVSTSRATLAFGLGADREANGPSSGSLAQLTLERLRRERTSAAPVPNQLLDRARGFSDRVRLLDLNPQERRVLALVDGRNDVYDLASRIAVPVEETAAILQRLVDVELLVDVAAQGSSRERGRTVLIREPDIEGFQKPLASLLRSRPDPVSLLSLAPESDVVDAIRRERPRMVILNASADDEVSDTARAVRAAADLATVALVAVLDPSMAPRASELSAAGFDAVLIKPVAYSELERLIDA